MTAASRCQNLTCRGAKQNSLKKPHKISQGKIKYSSECALNFLIYR